MLLAFLLRELRPYTDRRIVPPLLLGRSASKRPSDRAKHLDVGPDGTGIACSRMLDTMHWGRDDDPDQQTLYAIRASENWNGETRSKPAGRFTRPTAHMAMLRSSRPERPAMGPIPPRGPSAAFAARAVERRIAGAANRETGDGGRAEDEMPPAAPACCLHLTSPDLLRYPRITGTRFRLCYNRKR